VTASEKEGKVTIRQRKKPGIALEQKKKLPLKSGKQRIRKNT